MRQMGSLLKVEFKPGSSGTLSGEKAIGVRNQEHFLRIRGRKRGPEKKLYRLKGEGLEKLEGKGGR